MARTNFFYLLVSSFCSGLPVFCVRLFQPFALRDGSFYFGTAPWYFLSRCTWPQTSSNELTNRVKLAASSTYGRLHGIFFKKFAAGFQHELKRIVLVTRTGLDGAFYSSPRPH